MFFRFMFNALKLMSRMGEMADLRFLSHIPTFFTLLVQMVTAIIFLPRQWIHACLRKHFNVLKWLNPLLAFQKQSLKAKAMYFIGRAAENTKTAKRSFILIKYTLAAGQDCRRDSDLNCTASEINLMASGVYVTFCVWVCTCVQLLCICLYISFKNSYDFFH